jgi:hypothetical protein
VQRVRPRFAVLAQVEVHLPHGQHAGLRPLHGIEDAFQQRALDEPVGALAREQERPRGLRAAAMRTRRYGEPRSTASTSALRLTTSSPAATSSAARSAPGARLGRSPGSGTDPVVPASRARVRRASGTIAVPSVSSTPSSGATFCPASFSASASAARSPGGRAAPAGASFAPVHASSTRPRSAAFSARTTARAAAQTPISRSARSTATSHAIVSSGRSSGTAVTPSSVGTRTGTCAPGAPANAAISTSRFAGASVSISAESSPAVASPSPVCASHSRASSPAGSAGARTISAMSASRSIPAILSARSGATAESTVSKSAGPVRLRASKKSSRNAKPPSGSRIRCEGLMMSPLASANERTTQSSVSRWQEHGIPPNRGQAPSFSWWSPWFATRHTYERVACPQASDG